VRRFHFDESRLLEFRDYYLTVQCNGCGTVSFCRETQCGDDDDIDEEGRLLVVRDREHYPGIPQPTASPAGRFVEPSHLDELDTLPNDRFDTAKLKQMLVELNHAYEQDSTKTQVEFRADMDVLYIGSHSHLTRQALIITTSAREAQLVVPRWAVRSSGRLP
jgi:hypothetical protein